MLLIQLEKNKLDAAPKNSHQFEFGVHELINMVGLEKNEGMEVIREIFQNKKFQLKNEKIWVQEIDEIMKQVSYYKKWIFLKKNEKQPKQIISFLNLFEVLTFSPLIPFLLVLDMDQNGLQHHLFLK